MLKDHFYKLGAYFTSSVLISCWVSSALVEHWVRRPSSRSAEMSIIDCTTSKARRISCSASSLSAILRAMVSSTRGSSPNQEDEPLLDGHNANHIRLLCRNAILSLLNLRVTKPLINIDNHLGRLSVTSIGAARRSGNLAHLFV